MSLSIVISNALSGITVSQAGLANVSQNVANANTVGYSRQVLDLQQRVIADISNGVEVAGINRIVDGFLIRELRIQLSALGAATAADTFFNEIQARFGTTANNTTSAADLANFAANFKNNSTLFDGFEKYDKKRPRIRLSEDGRKELAELIRELR